MKKMEKKLVKDLVVGDRFTYRKVQLQEKMHTVTVVGKENFACVKELFILDFNDGDYWVFNGLDSVNVKG